MCYYIYKIVFFFHATGTSINITYHVFFPSQGKFTFNVHDHKRACAFLQQNKKLYVAGMGHRADVSHRVNPVQGIHELWNDRELPLFCVKISLFAQRMRILRLMLFLILLRWAKGIYILYHDRAKNQYISNKINCSRQVRIFIIVERWKCSESEALLITMRNTLSSHEKLFVFNSLLIKIYQTFFD